LATGVCIPHSELLQEAESVAAARMLDGRIVAVTGGKYKGKTMAEVWGPPEQAALDTPWTWSALPAMGAGRRRSSTRVMSNGRFVVVGGESEYVYNRMSSLCEVLELGDNTHWGALPLMLDSRDGCACMAVAGCVIVAVGYQRETS